jgi:hypothetical protein
MCVCPTPAAAAAAAVPGAFVCPELVCPPIVATPIGLVKIKLEEWTTILLGRPLVTMGARKCVGDERLAAVANEALE